MKKALLLTSLLLGCSQTSKQCDFVADFPKDTSIKRSLQEYNDKVEKLVCDMINEEDFSPQRIASFVGEMNTLQGGLFSEGNDDDKKELGKQLALQGMFENNLLLEYQGQSGKHIKQIIPVYEAGVPLENGHDMEDFEIFQQQYPMVAKKWFQPSPAITRYQVPNPRQEKDFPKGTLIVKHLGNPSTFNNFHTNTSQIILRGYSSYYLGEVAKEHEEGHGKSFAYTSFAEQEDFYILTKAQGHDRHFRKTDFAELLADFYAYVLLQKHHPESMLELLMKPYLQEHVEATPSNVQELMIGFLHHLGEVGTDSRFPYLINTKYIDRLIQKEAISTGETANEVASKLFSHCFIEDKEGPLLPELSKRHPEIFQEMIEESAQMLRDAKVEEVTPSSQ